jgi:NAD(P)-dependent dehydrogenase (short-subunit alcohol dehydrogenase family)
MRSLVYGLAVTGASTVRALSRRGHEVVVVDDHVDDAKRAVADELGVELLSTPVAIDALVAGCDLVSPSPAATACPCGARSSWPTSGSRIARAEHDRSSPSPGPTARRRRACWRRRC